MERAQQLSASALALRGVASRLACLALLTLALASALSSWFLACLPGGEGLCSLDFYVFWTGSTALHSGLNTDVYSPVEAVRLGDHFSNVAASSGNVRMSHAAALFPALQPVSTPFLFSAFSLWTGDSFERDAAIFFGVSVSCYVAALWHLTRIHQVAPLPATAVGVAAFFPLSQISVDLQAGNVNGVQLALFCAAVAAARAPRSWRSSLIVGSLLSAATLFKPNLATVPALYVLHLFRQHRRGEACGVLAGGLAALIGVELLVSSTWSYPTPWTAWAGAMHAFLLSPRPASHSNSSLSSLVGDALGHSNVAVALLPLVAICLGALAVLRIPRQSLRTATAHLSARKLDTLVLYAGAAVGVVCSKPMWSHYLALLVPCALEATFPLLAAERDSRPFRWLSTAMTLAVPVVSLPLITAVLGLSCSASVVAWSQALYAICIYGVVLGRTVGARTTGASDRTPSTRTGTQSRRYPPRYGWRWKEVPERSVRRKRSPDL